MHLRLALKQFIKFIKDTACRGLLGGEVEGGEGQDWCVLCCVVPQVQVHIHTSVSVCAYTSCSCMSELLTTCPG